jgi:hypothetical protein
MPRQFQNERHRAAVTALRTRSDLRSNLLDAVHRHGRAEGDDIEPTRLAVHARLRDLIDCERRMAAARRHPPPP